MEQTDKKQEKLVDVNEVNNNNDDKGFSWMNDSQCTNCTECNKKFGMTIRKHHCRACGKIYCAECASHFLLLPAHMIKRLESIEKVQKVQRCCAMCFKVHSNIDFHTKFDVSGPPNAPVLILLHDVAFTRRMWKYQMEFFSFQYRTFAIDLPGHGSRMDFTLTLSSAHAVINEIMEHFVTPLRKQCTIWGHHLGGFIAASFVASHPNTCSAIVLSGMNERLNEFEVNLGKRLTNAFKLSKFNLATLIFKEYENGNINIDKNLFEESFVRCGSYYNAWDDALKIINQPNYELLLSQFNIPMLIINNISTINSTGNNSYDSNNNNNNADNNTNNSNNENQCKLATWANNAKIVNLQNANHLFFADEHFRDYANTEVLHFIESVILDTYNAKTKSINMSLNIIDNDTTNSNNNSTNYNNNHNNTNFNNSSNSFSKSKTEVIEINKSGSNKATNNNNTNNNNNNNSINNSSVSSSMSPHSLSHYFNDYNSFERKTAMQISTLELLEEE